MEEILQRVEESEFQYNQEKGTLTVNQDSIGEFERDLQDIGDVVAEGKEIIGVYSREQDSTYMIGTGGIGAREIEFDVEKYAGNQLNQGVRTPSRPERDEKIRRILNSQDSDIDDSDPEYGELFDGIFEPSWTGDYNPEVNDDSSIL